MNVLVVHDRDEMASNIIAVVKECGADDLDCVLASDGTSARRELTKRRFDLLIVDLTLPHIKGRDVASYATADALLAEIFLLDDIKTPGDIIGITRESGAFESISTSIGSHVMTVVEEDSANHWRQRLSDKIRYLARAAQARRASLNSQHGVDLLLITALDAELAPYRKVYDFNADIFTPGAFTFGLTASNGMLKRGVAFAVGKSGEARAATATQSLLSLYRPRFVLMTGFCGGVEGKTALGDIIFAESAIDWDYGRWEDESELDTDGLSSPAVPVFRSRPGPVSIFDEPVHRSLREFLRMKKMEEPGFRERLRQVTEGKIQTIKEHLSPMASGSAVIASDQVLKSVRDLNGSIRGVDMECFGVYLACQSTHVARPQVLCIKGVSDFCNGLKNDEYHSACAEATCLVAQAFLQESLC